MIEEFIKNLKNHEYFSDQIVHHEIIPSKSAAYKTLVPSLHNKLKKALKSCNIHQLYSHQSEAITKVREKKNVLISTPTASGKSLTYNVPILESILKDRNARAFYIFPIKALEQDQLKSINELISEISEKNITAEIYDGDTSPYKKSKIKNNQPNIIITNPDMFHSGFLPYHSNWSDFFKNLKYIVVDELHTYRGIFGSHIAQIFRRINRIAEYYGATPQYITCSATIPNPKEFARELIGLPFEVVNINGAPQPNRHFLFINSKISPYTGCVSLIKLLLSKNLKVIAFTKSRKITELIHTWLIQQNEKLAPFVSSYRAGFLPEERRLIEKDLFEGKIKAVISTSALEVGIDIGGLDACILVGYPGTIINTWQRGGRAGRGDRPALVILMAQQDALDQYFMKYPGDFFARNYENAVLDPFNIPVLNAHIPCAAAELPLSFSERFFDIKKILPSIKELLHSGELLESKSDEIYFSSRKNPHRFVNIRSVGENYTILEKETNRVIGQVSGLRAYAECHKGAIYLHRAEQYLIESLDTKTKNVVAKKVNVSYFTRPKTDKETDIIEVIASKPVGNFIIRKGHVKVTEFITHFEKRKVKGQELLSTHDLELPPIIYETVGFWIEIESEIEKSVIMMGKHFMGGIHAVEHALISMFPLFALCDRDDIGGISTTFHHQVKKGAIFIYDGYPGGVGLAERGYEFIEKLLSSTLKLITSCNCDIGCPSCIHSPKCGSGNKPLDKTASVEVLERLLNIKPISNGDVTGLQSTDDFKTRKKVIPKKEKPKKRICYFDIETQRGASEVGGWNNVHLMKLAVGVVYDSLDNKYYSYLEENVNDLIEKLFTADLVVGFNIIRFDYQVLQSYTIRDMNKNKTFDILADIHSRLGYRLSLNHIAMKTLNVEKSADGLQSLKWFKEGRIDKIISYCNKDVEITKDIFLYGNKNGHILFEKDRCGVVKLPVKWDIENIIKKLNTDLQ